ALAQRLARHMDFPEGLEPRVHYLPGETVNAFATLGGRVVFFEGLVSQLPSENALALVLAHELAHLQLRHPIVAAGRGLTVSLALAATFGLADNAVVAQLVEWIGVTSTLSYSRDQEREADALAAQVVLAEYGHLRGARGLFDLFRDESGESSALVPDFRSTHPSIDERIQWLLTYAEEQGPMDHETAPITPLPWAQTP
ncbi:MAG: M48 family metallopeptidase, partial [Pseudomonadota bacterium]